MINKQRQLLTYDEHSSLLRRMLVRIFVAVIIITFVVFSNKEFLFSILLAPKQADFVFYRIIKAAASLLGIESRIDTFNVELISTELSSQFILHLTTSLYSAILLVSPYILIELFLFISPALLNAERKYAVPLLLSAYLMFIAGLLITYYIIFPFSFRFLGTYQVDPMVTSMITLSSYIQMFLSLSLIMGLTFELPVIMWIMGKLDIISFKLLIKYRKWAILIILVISAIITPPDIITLIIVSCPLVLLYELSIVIVKHIQDKPLA